MTDETKVKILVIGDPHFKVSNIDESERLVAGIIKLAKEEKPDSIVCLGDLLHTHDTLSTLCMNTVQEFLDKLRKIAPVHSIVGNHDMCFDESTPILILGGSIKIAKDIIVGDILIGDDGKSRRVLNTTSGFGKMYEVEQSGGDNYIVNENHMLCLKHIAPGNSTIDTIDMPIKEFIGLRKGIKDRLYGYMIGNVMTRIMVKEVKPSKYYGFEVNKNNRFLLGDSTVVHNCNNSQYLSTNHWMNGMKKWDNITIVDKVVITIIKGKKFVFVPYVFPGRFEEALNTEGEVWKDASCIFAHQEFYGCKMGAITSIEGDKWSLDYPDVVSGHIHSNQKIQKNIYYPGSAMQHAFGESSKNVIAVLTFSEDDDYICNEVNLGLPRKKILYKSVEDMEEYIIPKTEDKLKITLSGEREEFKSFKKTKKYKNIVKSGIKVVFKPKKLVINEKEADIDIDSNFQTILDDIIKQQKNEYLYEVYKLVINKKV
jgi:DNA repair exonuclease SbcCD nuclease subunit